MTSPSLLVAPHLSNTQKAVVDLLRHGEMMTYDRIAEAVGIEPRGIYQSALRPLEKYGIIHRTHGGSTVLGRTGAQFSIDERKYPKGSLPHEQSLFDVGFYRPTTQDIITRAINTMTSGTPIRTVATQIIDRITTIDMTSPENHRRIFEVPPISSPRRGAGVLAPDVRARVYAEICKSSTTGITRKEITAATGLSSSSVIPRVGELLTQGYIHQSDDKPRSQKRVFARDPKNYRIPVSITNTYRDDRLEIINTIASMISNPIYLADPQQLCTKVQNEIAAFLKKHSVVKKNTAS